MYLPFGFGGRACIGKRLAYVEGVYLLAFIVACVAQWYLYFDFVASRFLYNKNSKPQNGCPYPSMVPGLRR